MRFYGGFHRKFPVVLRISKSLSPHPKSLSGGEGLESSLIAKEQKSNFLSLFW